MLSNQVLQKMIADFHEILEKDCSVWDDRGKCLASTCKSVDVIQYMVEDFLQESYLKEMQIEKDRACFAVSEDGEIQYVLAIHGASEGIETVGRLCVSQIKNLIQAYRKRVDKNRFYQELLLEHVLPVDIYGQAKRLNIQDEERRIVFVIEPKQEGDNLVLETLRGLYATGTKDVITSVEEGKIVLIKVLEAKDEYEEVVGIARTIIDTLSAEAMVDLRVAYGTIVEELKELSRSYKEAVMALEIGQAFYGEKSILAYNELGIGRLIHQLPVSLCEVFLKEVFCGNAMQQFDNETLATVNAFFKNNLNISETARQMYLHRNTLGYRLDKITRTTGLDVRKFDDALTFKIALMVSAHMKYSQAKEEEQK